MNKKYIQVKVETHACDTCLNDRNHFVFCWELFSRLYRLSISESVVSKSKCLNIVLPKKLSKLCVFRNWDPYKIRCNFWIIIESEVNIAALIIILNCNWEDLLIYDTLHFQVFYIWSWIIIWCLCTSCVCTHTQNSIDVWW